MQTTSCLKDVPCFVSFSHHDDYQLAYFPSSSKARNAMVLIIEKHAFAAPHVIDYLFPNFFVGDIFL